MKTIMITPEMVHFIKSACNLKEAIYDFWVNDEDFKSFYGISKTEAVEMILNLKNKLDVKTQFE